MPTGADDNFVNSAAAAKATLDTGLVRSLFAVREGFGANTTGGLNGEIYVVTNLNDSGPGSLRFAAESSQALWITFAPSLHGGTIALDSTIYLGANKTIDGRGSDITLTNNGITIGGNWGASNDIIAGLTITNMHAPSWDNIMIYGVDNIWVTRCTLSGVGQDGLLDISDGTRNVTIDTTLFKDSDYGIMINSYSTSPDPHNPSGEILNGHELDNYVRDSAVHVTLHDNVFDNVDQRSPRAIFGEIHMYNNLEKDWDGYGIGASFRSEVLLEGNIFDNSGPYGNKAIITQLGIDPEPGFVRSVDNLFLGTASGGSSGASHVFTPTYAYSYDTPTVGLEAKLLSRAGADGDATLDFTALTPSVIIATIYTAAFGRGADAAGFDYWLSQLNHGLSLGAIANSFSSSPETKALYPFLANPHNATDSNIHTFLNEVYNNLFNRAPDVLGLAYWTGQIKAGRPVGSILLDIVDGAQDTTGACDITTLLSKATVSIAYVEAQAAAGSKWTTADDKAEATALLDAVTDNAPTMLVGIAQAHALVMADII